MKAKKRVQRVKVLLEEVGLEGDRIEMYNIGASDAVQFVSACNEMVERARNLGPNPLRMKEEVKTV